MGKPGKRYGAASKTIDRDKQYPLAEAIDLIKAGDVPKFDESIDVAINLGVDPRHADQMVPPIGLIIARSTPQPRPNQSLNSTGLFSLALDVSIPHTRFVFLAARPSRGGQVSSIASSATIPNHPKSACEVGCCRRR